MSNSNQASKRTLGQLGVIKILNLIVLIWRTNPSFILT
jgi:hypothetical protein